MIHQPVLVKEVSALLNLQPGKIIIDATIGSGGHSAAIIPLIQPIDSPAKAGSLQAGWLIGIDRDENAIRRVKQRLDSEFTPSRQRDGNIKISLFCDNFINLGNILKRLGLKGADGILLDLGVSSEQLAESSRGFSFQTTGPLDMRMDRGIKLTAEEIIRRSSLEDLMRIFRTGGEERWARRVARAIVKHRQRVPIKTTTDLAKLIERIIPRRGRIHPATRIFQALRITVNQELENLSAFLEDCANYLNPAGRLAIISYHSGEDRLVKTAFRQRAREGILQIITLKPVGSSREEVLANPRARSAKLRVAEKM